MTIQYVDDHVGQGLGLLLSQFDRSPLLRGVVRTVLSQVQEIENTALDLYFSRTLEGASGAQLDALGRLVGENREGLTDDQLRRIIKAKAQVLLSQGERFRLEDLVRLAIGGPDQADSIRVFSIFELISGLEDLEISPVETGDVLVLPNYPAGITVSYLVEVGLSDAFQKKIKSLIEAALPSGVGSVLIESEVGYFGFSGDPASLGFGEGIFSEII